MFKLFKFSPCKICTICCLFTGILLKCSKNFLIHRSFFRIYKFSNTGCSLNIVFFFEDLKIFGTLAFLCFPSVSVCITHQAGRTPELQQKWQSSEKSQILRKNTIINEHPVTSRMDLHVDIQIYGQTNQSVRVALRLKSLQSVTFYNINHRSAFLWQTDQP